MSGHFLLEFERLHFLHFIKNIKNAENSAIKTFFTLIIIIYCKTNKFLFQQSV